MLGMAIKRKNRWIKAAALLLASVTVLSLTGCGRGEEQEVTEEVQQGIGGFVYVPEYFKLPVGENDYYDNIFMSGNSVYYSVSNWNEETMESTQKFYSMAIGGGESTLLPINLEPNTSSMKTAIDQEGNMVMFLQDYSSQELDEQGIGKTYIYLRKYNPQGELLYDHDVTEVLSKDTGYSYIQHMVLDNDGRIYAGADRNIWLFDAEGVSQGSITMNDWINSLGMGKDGKVYFTQYGAEGMELVEIDFAAKAAGKAYKNFPAVNGNGAIIPGLEKDFLVADSADLYEYDLATESSEKLLNWLDCDINGQYVEYISPTQDGKLLTVIRDWSSSTNSTELALLTKTDSSQIAQREIITIGTLDTNQSLQAYAVNFNKSNDKYRIKVENYLDRNSQSMSSYQDAIAAMNTAITSGNGPDIFDLTTGIDIGAYVSKGLLEDMNTYLEKSEKIKKEDFLESILDAFTFDGVLTCIPGDFTIQTVMAKSSMVGEEMGWTLDDLMALAEEYPEASVFEFANQNMMLSYCMRYNQNAFIDMESGQCSFDSDEFRKVLEYAASFPEEANIDSERSLPARIHDGDVLLNDCYLSNPESFSVNRQMFDGEPVTCIGYPTVDGSVGCTLMPGNGSYGISAKSDKKEGAWSFIEFMLSDDSLNSTFSHSFPTRKDKLEAVFEEAMETEYVRDENGEPLLDENGEPMRQSKGSWGWGNDDFTITVYASTQEEIDELREVIAVAKPGMSNDSQVMQIIQEEAQPYFSGQKSVDEVSKVIQSRVQIYISENS